MTKEVFNNFLVVLDTVNHGIMQSGNHLAHRFTIKEGRTYSEHPAFLLFLDGMLPVFLVERFGGEGAKINHASERKWKGLKKKASE